MKLPVIGIDPSLRSFGFATAIYDTDTGLLENVSVDIEQTKPSDKHTKKTTRQNCLDLLDAQIMQSAMKERATGKFVAFTEIPVGSQSARSMASYGICVGIMSSCPCAIIPVTPTQVKRAGFGKTTATKEEQIEWAVAKHPEAPWFRVKKTGELLGKNEHCADALAAIYAGIQTPEFKSLLSMIADA